MRLTNYHQMNKVHFNPQPAVDVLCESGVLESMPLMVIMARKHFSCSERPNTAVGNLKLRTKLTDDRVCELGRNLSKYYVADMDVALLDEDLQVWQFSLPSGTESIWHFVYQVVVNEETAEIQQIDVGELAAPQSPG